MLMHAFGGPSGIRDPESPYRTALDAQGCFMVYFWLVVQILFIALNASACIGQTKPRHLLHFVMIST